MKKDPIFIIMVILCLLLDVVAIMTIFRPDTYNANMIFNGITYLFIIFFTVISLGIINFVLAGYYAIKKEVLPIGQTIITLGYFICQSVFSLNALTYATTSIYFVIVSILFLAMFLLITTFVMKLSLITGVWSESFNKFKKKA